MPKIYELFGFPVADNSTAVLESRKRAFCPFISEMCDGGGNRYMSDIDLKGHPELKELYPTFSHIPSGVCSIQLSEDSSPWIICPRRLLYMGEKANTDVLSGKTQRKLFEKCNFPKGTDVGIWAEAKVKYIDDRRNESPMSFDYTFDYVLMPLGRVKQSQAVAESG